MRYTRPMIEYARQRKHPRVEVNLESKLFLRADADDGVPAELANVARGGVFVKTANPATVGARVSVCFRMLATRVCEAEGKVVWSNSGRGGFGVQFEKTNHEMDCFMRSLSNLPRKLRPVYLRDVLEPHIRVTGDDN